jgi:ATP-dependent protease HslVU (ClpYQ) ATPase subunit
MFLDERRVKGKFPMPTQEERLETVEYGLKQFKTETIKAYGEMAMELVMVKGLTEDAVKRLASLKTQIDQQFERVGTHLDTLDTRLDTLGTRLVTIETLLTQILARLPEAP